MNKKQWFIFGIGLTLFSWFMFYMIFPCINLTGDVLIACYIRRYAFAVPALISQILGILFIFCGWFEK